MIFIVGSRTESRSGQFDRIRIKPKGSDPIESGSGTLLVSKNKMKNVFKKPKKQKSKNEKMGPFKKNLAKLFF